MEGLNLVTIGRSVFIDEIADTFQAGQLETVGVSEGKALHRSGSVVSGLGRFDLVVEENDLGTGPSEDFVGSSEFANNRIGFRFHVDSGCGCDVHVAVISKRI